MQKSHKEGVYTRKNKYGITSYIITYTIDNKVFKKKVGTDEDGWTITKAYKERLKRISLGIEDTHKKENISTLDQVANEYLQSISHKADHPQILSKYNNHIKEKLGHIALDKVTVSDVQRLKQVLSVKVSRKTRRVLSRKTVDEIIGLIHTIYRYHNKIHYDTPVRSPASKDCVERYGGDNSRLRFLTKEEFHLLLETIESRREITDMKYVHEHLTEEMLLYAKVLVTTGMRTYSALTLRAKDFDFEKGTIQVKNHKSNRIYTSFIHESVKEELQTLCHKIEPEFYIFGRNNEPYHRSTINKRLLPIMHTLFNQSVTDRRERVVVHSLRHTFGSWLAQNGTSLYIISKLMDHATISQTQVYAKLMPNSGADALLGLNI
jgi:integrase